jgi:2Fe-2S ferredoxin
MPEFCHLTVIDREGVSSEMEVPTDVSVNLMEVLKGEGFPILATCGGMALCGTCHALILDGFDLLPPRTDEELDMLDILPETFDNSRLCCQIKASQLPERITVQLAAIED